MQAVKEDTAQVMSENVELVRRAYEAWNEGGPESITQFMAEDFEFHDPPNLPDPRVVRGRDAVAAYLADQRKILGDMKLTIIDVRARGGTVAVRMEATIHGAESGIDVPGELSQVSEIADGRWQRTRGFLTWAEALEAAGLPE
jgi:ketosteroid isomerase-like protein